MFLKYNILNYLNSHSAKELYDYIDYILYNKSKIETDMLSNTIKLMKENIEPAKPKPFKKYNGDILNIANYYKLKLHGNKTICPFHADTQPSLMFYPKTNSFFCFGCRSTGDVIKFIGMMEDTNEKKRGNTNSQG